MARLCIRVLPNNHPKDPDLDLVRTQPGDVVCVMPDKHEWSAGELACGQYKFVEVPGITPEDFARLIESRFDKDNILMCIRNMGLDPDALKTGDWATSTKAEIDDIAAIKVFDVVKV